MTPHPPQYVATPPKSRALFITDSLGLPRLVPERVTADEVWTTRVAKALSRDFAFFYYTRGGMHSGGLNADLNVHVAAFEAEVVILQVGIVDCAPRALSENEAKVALRLPGPLGRFVHAVVRRYYGQIIRARDIAYVSEREFEENLSAVRRAFGAAEFVVVPIGSPNTAYKRKNPLIARNVGRYNDVLVSVFGNGVLSGLFDGLELERTFVSDNHHLSPSGHAHVAQGVIARLEQLREQHDSPSK